jgi:fructuronate reductase
MRLSLAALGSVPAAYRPATDPRQRRIGIVHLGIGAFHRAHQAFYTDACDGWGICGITQRSDTVVRQLAPQDGLYTLLVRPGGGAAEPRVIGAVREVRFAGDDPGAVAARIADPDVTVVTLTVSEKGYRHDPATGMLRLADPEIAADLAGRPPRTVIGQLAAGLAARTAAGGGPLTVLCCDNLPSNGPTVEGLTGQYVQRMPGAGRLAGWIAESVTFPATMVDRIVPATTGADRAEAARLLGAEDDATVVAEPFTQWVIEDRFAAGRPAWEKAGAQIVGDVAPYETAKLRMLNGAHSALAYLGGLAGHDYIAEAVADEALAACARRLMDDDVAPTLAPPPDLGLREYADEVLRRFGNPALRHRTRQVAMDGSQKLPQRLLGTVRDRLAAGAEPVFAALAVAAWMRHIATGRAEDGRPFPPDDPLAPLLAGRLAGADDPAAVVRALLGVTGIFGDLSSSGVLRDLLTGLLTQLSRDGVHATVRTLL